MIWTGRPPVEPAPSECHRICNQHVGETRFFGLASLRYALDEAYVGVIALDA